MAHIHEKIDFTVGALIVHDGCVLLVHHKELGVWVVPGGHIELDEDADQALFREIEEETGLKEHDLEILCERSSVVGDVGVKQLYIPRWMNIHPINSHHKHMVLEYLFRAKTDVVKLEEDAHHEIRWFTKEDIDNPSFKIPRELREYSKEAIKAVQ